MKRKSQRRGSWLKMIHDIPTFMENEWYHLQKELFESRQDDITTNQRTIRCLGIELYIKPIPVKERDGA